MKRLIALLFLLASPSFATTTVTGTINNLGTGSSGSATFVRFWLRGCGGNQPRVSGTAVIAPSQGGVFYFDIAANSSGAVSGTLYSTRDSTGNSGGEIECGGSTTSEWYGMQIFVNGQGGPETPIQARNTTTIDISNVTPITTNPVVTAPTGDTTYFRIDGGNSGLKYAAGTITASEPVVGFAFNNIQYVDGVHYPCTDVGLSSAIAAIGSGYGVVNAQGCSSISIASTVFYGPKIKILFNPQGTETSTVAGIALQCSDTPTSYDGDGGLFDLNLTSSTNNAVAVDVKECTWYQLHNDSISLTGTGTVGVRLENTAKWTEQTDFDNLHIFAATGIDLQDNCASHTGCPSFAYARWRHVVVSPSGTGIGYLMENDSNLNGSDLEIQCFGSGTAAITCLSFTGTSNMELNRLKLGGESPGPASNTGVSVGVSASFFPTMLWEQWNSGTWSDSLSGTVIPYIYTTPGYGNIIASPDGLRIGNTTNAFDVTFDSHSISTYRTLTAPDATGTFCISTLCDLAQNVSPSNPISGRDRLNFDTSDIFGPLTSTGAFTRSKWSGLIATGTATLTGTGACATNSTQKGGAWAGQATCTGTTGASTFIITPGTAAPNGWSCTASDLTTAANILRQSAVSTTACTIAGTVNANDVLTFTAVAY